MRAQLHCWTPSTHLALSADATPAADTLRYTYLLDTLVRHHHHCLFVGPTGTGKTVYVKKHLQAGLPQDEFVSLIVTFSAQTMSNMTQVCCVPAAMWFTAGTV
jgi:Cdc6-like AAA superfamily ATPase